ncbi:hypothetical protein Cs7R123_13750 [Catellatospora sp. TT07R-123]|uniref:hypothetical protein n=1 Tax=Catellatospora sp. TT07R-123 TaxID=2733863 RepID=UPI001B030D5F|nr:hypothetical protein [Catellatospora sp. TT07R-123]GHJ44033.1 hypothetical protein Cs7R123_13750 [Catellatospora sp. TT07R-123]
MAIDEVRWDRLLHPYGVASDMPAQLEALCGVAAGAAFGALWPVPPEWPARTRAMTAAALVVLVRDPALADRRAEIVAYHREAAAAAADRWECASYVIGLGDLGEAPREWLDDPRLAVRVCAALAPALADDPTAVKLLVRTAQTPRALDESFSEPFAPRSRPPAPWEEPPHQVLLRTVCERVSDFGRLYPAACAAAELHGSVAFGPYLPVAFPDGLPPDRQATGPQSAFAQLLADRDDLWDGTRPQAAAVFTAAGLPADREQWRAVRVPEPVDAQGRPSYDAALIVVLEGAAAIRRRPSMYLGAGRTSPELLPRLLAEFTENGAAVQVEEPLTLTAEIPERLGRPFSDDGHAITWRIKHASSLGVLFAAAVSLRMSIHQWIDGVAYRQQFVEGVAQGPAEVLGRVDRPDGVRFVFELDPDWLPPGSRLPGA